MFRGYFYIFKLPFINYTIQYFTYKFWDKRVQEIEKEKGGKNGKNTFRNKNIRLECFGTTTAHTECSKRKGT